MKTEVKKIDSTKREIHIEISGEVVKNKFDKVFERIGQEAKVRGFRPGHIPRDVLEKHFSSDVHQLVLKELVPDIYNKAIEKEKLEAIELSSISEVKLDRESLSFKAKVEIIPDIAIKNYKGIRVNYKNIEVSTDEIKRNIDSLKEARKADTLDDNFAKGLGYPSLTELENAIEKQLFIQKENLRRQKMEEEIVQELTNSLDFQLPQSLIDKQLKELVRQAKVELALRGAPREEIEKQEKTLSEQLESEAKRQVKAYLVFLAIAKKENIPQDDHMSLRVMEFLLREASWQTNPTD